MGSGLVKARRGRKPTTGNCETREELEASVVRYYFHSVNPNGTNVSIADVARLYRISEATVQKILAAAVQPTATEPKGVV